jgi:putative transposase
MVEYLKAGNRILRGKLPRKLTVTARERSRLLRFGAALGSAIEDLVTTASARTFARWKAADAGEARPALPKG